MVVLFICATLTCAKGLDPIKLAELQKESTMSKVIDTAYITITRIEGSNRKAMIKGFSKPIFYGLHGGLKKSFTEQSKKRMRKMH